jgi:hypothetical protein
MANRVMICFQVLAYGSYSVLVHLCEVNGTLTSSSTMMNFVHEFVKLSISCGAILYSTPTHSNSYAMKQQTVSWLRQSLPYSIPGILYFLNHNLAVHMQLHMDPASYQILSNFKIMTTGILYRLIIKHKLSNQQWFALSLLFLGGLTFSIGKKEQLTADRSSTTSRLSLGSLKSSSFVSKQVSATSIIMPEMYIHPIGIPMIAIYCLISGFAGV